MAYQQYNPNPRGRNVGDCSVRAIAKALNLSWEDAYAQLTAVGYTLGDMPSADAIWGTVLRQHHYIRGMIPNSCPDCYTAEDFCQDHPRGTFVLAFGGHVATVVDGILYDSWDSSMEIPQYYWYRKDL